jgi:hypothetical protein
MSLQLSAQGLDWNRQCGIGGGEVEGGGEPAERAIIGQAEAVLPLQDLGEMLLHPGMQHRKGVPGELIGVSGFGVHAGLPAEIRSRCSSERLVS